MNGSLRNSSQRSPFDVVMFVITVIGFFTGVAGTIVASIPTAILGAVLICLGLAYFALTAS